MWCRINKILFWLFLLALALASCKKEPKIEKKTVARVGDAVLTDYDLELMLGEEKYSRKHRMEFIKDWVEKEMLYREAKQNNLTDNEEFVQLLKNTEKELAAARQLEYFLDGDDEDFSRGELEDYFEKFKEDFRLESDAYLMNIAKFHDKNKAIDFRSSAIENGWNDAIGDFEKFIESKSENEFLFDFELAPVQVLRTVQSLNNNEFSIVIDLGQYLFEVVQLKQKFRKGDIPEMEFVKNEVESRLKNKKRRELIQEYISNLYSKYDVVINGEN